MAKTKIEWATYTFNPFRGCTKVSAGCENCYAESMSVRNPKVLGVWGPNGVRSVAAESYWKAPESWNEQAEVDGDRPRVFCASLADVFEDWEHKPMHDSQGNQLWFVDDGATTTWSKKELKGSGYFCRPLTMDDVRRRLFFLIDRTPHLDWLLVTKRPENIRKFWPSKCMPRSVNVDLVTTQHPEFDRWWARRNVWLLTSVEDQATMAKRTPHLLECNRMAPVLGLSAEPLLALTHVDAIDVPNGDTDDWVSRWNPLDGFRGTKGGGFHAEARINWVITGCESDGQKVGRFADGYEYACRTILDACARYGCAAFNKQAAIDGRLSKDPSEWPEDLRVREFPNV